MHFLSVKHGISTVYLHLGKLGLGSRAMVDLCEWWFTNDFLINLRSHQKHKEVVKWTKPKYVSIVRNSLWRPDPSNLQPLTMYTGSEREKKGNWCKFILTQHNPSSSFTFKNVTVNLLAQLEVISSKFHAEYRHDSHVLNMFTLYSLLVSDIAIKLTGQALRQTAV